MAQAVGLRDGYGHSFIVVIEMRALSPAHSLLWSNCVLQRAAATLCDDGLMIAPKMLRLRSSTVKCENSSHTAPQEVRFGSGRASA